MASEAVSSTVEGSHSTPPLVNFDQELNRLMAPLLKQFSEGSLLPSVDGEDKIIGDPAEGADGLVAPLAPLRAVSYLDEDHVSELQEDMEATLRNGNESVEALVLIREGLDSLLETLASIEYGKRHGAPLSGVATAVPSSSGAESGPSDNDSAKRLSACLTQLEGLYRELDSPTLDVTASRFASLLQELNDAATDFKGFSLPSAMRADNYRKIFFAFDKAHTLLRDAVRNSIIECKMAVHNSGVLPEAVKSISGLGRGKGYSTELLSSPKMVEEHINAWRGTFSAINNVFMQKMDQYSSLRRLLEFVEKSMTPYTDSSSAAEVSLGPVFDIYIRTRTHFLVVILRWWLRQGTASASDFTKSFQPPSVRTSPLSKDESKIVVDVAEETTEVLSSFVQEALMALEAAMELEKAVLDRVWLLDEFALGILPQLLSTLSEETYCVFRSLLLRVDDVTELAQTIECIEAVRVYCSKRKLVKLAELWVKMTQDTQERLIFRASIYLRQNLAGKTPTVDWVRKYRSIREEVDTMKVDDQSQPLEYYSTFPITVELLEALHRTLTAGIFSVLAEEAIRLCLTQISQLVKLMRATPPSDELITLLTELAHVNFLHHHLAAMDANITVVERKLDLGQSLRYRKIKIVESSRESMQSVENQFAACYQQLVELLKKNISASVPSAEKDNQAKNEAALDEMKKQTSFYEQLLLRFIPDQWLRAKILLPVYQIVEGFKA